MADENPATPVSESVRITAPPGVVWTMVSDVTRMGEWSPETTSCRWVGGADGPTVGAAFVGTNRNKVWRWSTRCRVTEAVPGESFAFDVSFMGMPVSNWRYDISAVADGCEVTESTTDARGEFIKRLAVVGTGVHDRVARNRATMRATLAALAAAARAGAGAGAGRGWGWGWGWSSDRGWNGSQEDRSRGTDPDAGRPAPPLIPPVTEGARSSHAPHVQ